MSGFFIKDETHLKTPSVWSQASKSSAAGLALRAHVREVTGRAPKFEMCPGLLEIRFYAERGMPAYAYGPGLLAVAHGPKELIHVDRMVECAAVYARTAATVLHRY
jgi:succinyl-diaminopimelate desuccinylase